MNISRSEPFGPVLSETATGTSSGAVGRPANGAGQALARGSSWTPARQTFSVHPHSVGPWPMPAPASRSSRSSRQDATAPLLFSSFRPEALAGARETAPDVPRALLVDSLWADWFDVARSLGCRAVVSNHRLMDAALLAQLHTAGLRGLCYTVNESADAQRLLALGIDGLITDAVDRFSPVASR